MKRPILAAVLLACAVSPGIAAESPAPQPTLTYADIADLAVSAPVAARVRIRDAIPLTGERAVGVPAGVTRYFVEADIVALLRAPRDLPGRVRYLVDVPLQANGRPQRIRSRSEHLILAAPVAGRPQELRLSAPDAQLAWSQAEEDRLRALVAEATRPDAPPAVTGIGRAFHVRGNLPGESETQLFLLTADGRPISINVLRRPGQQPRWAVALGEIVDEAAEPPRPGSLLWYRLACSLPAQLPQSSLAEEDPQSAAAARADYALVIEGLGRCVRTRTRR
jgi:hypothetical protein